MLYLTKYVVFNLIHNSYLVFTVNGIIDDLKTQALINGYVLSVYTEKQEYKVVDAIRPLLKKFAGVCIVSDAKWIAH